MSKKLTKRETTTANARIFDDGGEIIWFNGRSNEALRLRRPCPCGCDLRNAPPGMVGYLIGSDGCGNGVTVHIRNEDVYKALVRVLRANGGDADE